MEHITEIQLIEFAAGNLHVETAKLVENHINQCPSCANTLSEITRTWKTANQWQPEIEISDTPHQFAQKVLSRDKKHRTLSLRTKIIQTSFRYAASILIAVALGATLGKQSVSPDTVNHFGQSNPEYLAALSMQWSSDLTWTILENDQPQQEEQQ
ncbi:MAG: hypothetical protein KAS23_09490 [Anaerohalosphaera sp.]|nr:hypothetical protein [Anaerohalosphaera sp.]